MATVTYTYTPANGDTPDATDFMGNFTVLKTLLETTKLDTANLSTPYAQFEASFTHTGTLAAAATHVFRKKVPSGQTWVPVSVSFSFTSGASAVPTFQFTDDGGNVLTSALTASLPATTYESTAFSITSIAAASDLVFTMTGVTATATDLYASVTFKVLLRS